MELSTRATVAATVVATLVVLGAIAGVAWLVRGTPATPSISALTTDEAASTVPASGFSDPWAEFEERCRPVLDAVWAPTPADIEQMERQNARMIAALEEAGVAYEVVSHEPGYEHVEPAGDDEASYREFDRVMESVYRDGGLGEEERAEMDARNAELIALFEEAGVAYEVFSEGDGWEHVEAVDEAGFELMEQYYRGRERVELEERATVHGLDVDQVLACHDEERELFAMEDRMHLPFPFHMDLRMASEQKALVEDLMAAFDEAGIAYERMDVPYVRWDVEDEAAADIVRAVSEEHGYVSEEFEGGMVMEEHAVEVEAEPAG